MTSTLIYDMRLVAAELGLSVEYINGYYEYNNKNGERVATVGRGDCRDREELVALLKTPTKLERAEALSQLARMDAELIERQ